MHWTKEYFEHAYLERWGLTPPSPTNREEARWFLSQLRPAASAPILDLACGHGRYTLALSDLGPRVVGMDASRALLARAREQSVAAARPAWVRGDMRWLPFPRCFGAIVFLDSYGFFDDDEDGLVLRESHRVLIPDGRLLIAVANAAPIVARFRARDVERRGRVTIRIDRTLERTPTRLIEGVSILEDGKVSQSERHQRLYSAAELEGQLHTASFTTLEVFADYEGAPFRERESSRIVVLAQAAA